MKIINLVEKCLCSISILLLSAISFLAIALPVRAQQNIELPAGECFVVVASRKSLYEVSEFLEGVDDGFTDVRVFKSKNDWYAISVGKAPSNISAGVISSLVASKRIPSDSRCSTGKSYLSEVDITEIRGIFEEQKNYVEQLKRIERAMLEQNEMHSIDSVLTTMRPSIRPQENTATTALANVTFAFLEPQETLGDAFEQYSAPKGKILIPMRLVIQFQQPVTSIEPSKLLVEIGTETGARYPLNAAATDALAAQFGTASSIDLPVWSSGEPILLAFEVPRTNAVAREIYIQADGIKFTPAQE